MRIKSCPICTKKSNERGSIDIDTVRNVTYIMCIHCHHTVMSKNIKIAIDEWNK